MTDQPRSLREAIAKALADTNHEHGGIYRKLTELYPSTAGEVAACAVAQWFRDHETERVEAVVRDLGKYGIPAASDSALVRDFLHASDAVVFPAREEQS